MTGHIDYNRIRLRRKFLCSPEGLAFCSVKQGGNSSARQRTNF
ncbi:hypothetical protein HMPREF1548_03736 [Clostridium sp. KLE 1755]|nr:hypothetical protein HMPREF1548_03736 [Clostridium sp. KLE 1755]